jgi:hypothetical protein
MILLCMCVVISAYKLSYAENGLVFSCLSCEFVNTTVLNISNVSLKTFVKSSRYKIVVQLKYLTDGIERLNLHYDINRVVVI